MTEFNYNREYSLSVTGVRGVVNTLVELIPNPVVFGANGSTSGSEVYRERSAFENGSTIWKSSTTTRTFDKDTVEITDLQIMATITASNITDGSKGGTATIKVFNLATGTREIISTKNNMITLRAGYSSDGSLPTIFMGQVTKSFTKREGHDIITYLECSEGASQKDSIRVSLNAEDTLGRKPRTYGDIFEALAIMWNDNGVATGKLYLDHNAPFAPVVQNSPRDTLLEKGYVFTGFLKKAMEDLCRDFNYTWQIVNNRLFVHPKFFKDMFSTVTISEDQIISIEKAHGSRANQASTEESKGVVIKMLLDGRVTTVDRVKVSGGRLASTYKVSSVKHSLNFEGSDWTTTLTCEGI